MVRWFNSVSIHFACTRITILNQFCFYTILCGQGVAHAPHISRGVAWEVCSKHAMLWDPSDVGGHGPFGAQDIIGSVAWALQI